MENKNIFDKIESEYNFVGNSYDKSGNFTGHFYYYSITLNLFPTQIDQVKLRFSKFNVTHLFSNYYIIGFNKTLKK